MDEFKQCDSELEFSDGDDVIYSLRCQHPFDHTGDDHFYEGKTGLGQTFHVKWVDSDSEVVTEPLPEGVVEVEEFRNAEGEFVPADKQDVDGEPEVIRHRKRTKVVKEAKAVRAPKAKKK